MAAGFVAVATEVDHIIAKANGGGDDDSNLQSICRPCHRRKTAADRMQRRLNKTGADIKSFPRHLKNRRRDQKNVGAELDRGGMSGREVVGARG